MTEPNGTLTVHEVVTWLMWHRLDAAAVPIIPLAPEEMRLDAGRFARFVDFPDPSFHRLVFDDDVRDSTFLMQPSMFVRRMARWVTWIASETTGSWSLGFYGRKEGRSVLPLVTILDFKNLQDATHFKLLWS